MGSTCRVNAASAASQNRKAGKPDRAARQDKRLRADIDAGLAYFWSKRPRIQRPIAHLGGGSV